MADIFWANFGKYGAIGQGITIVSAHAVDGSATTSVNPPSSMLGEWTTIVAGSYVSGIGNTTSEFTPTFGSARFGTGVNMYLYATNGEGTGTAYGFLNMTLPGGSRNRIIGGFAITPNLSINQYLGVLLCDGSGNAQIGLSFNQDGFIQVLSGSNIVGVPTTVLATSTNSISSGSSHWVEFDITINNSTGAYTIDVDGTTWLSATGVDTRGGTTNNSANVFTLFAQTNITTTTNSCGTIGESMYLFDSTGGVNNAIFGIGEVELKLPISDSSVQFIPQAGVVGYYWNCNTNLSNAPGANKLVLIPFTPAANCTINSVEIEPAASSGAANFKPVIYSDSSGKPNSLLSSGSQVTGCVSGTPLTLTLTSSQSLTSGTQYWIGYITDTSVALSLSYETGDPLLGQEATNTYTSGAPGTAPTMTAGQTTWQIWGNVTGAAHNFSEVNLVPPPGTLSYVAGGTVSNEDQYNFQSLSGSPVTIAGVKISSYMQLSSAGTRTVNLQVVSGSGQSGGSNPGFTPPTSWEWESTYLDTDPNTSSAWTASGVNAATAGPLIES